LNTIARDKNLQKQGQAFAYLDEQQAFFTRIRSLLSSDDLTFQNPTLIPIYKEVDKADRHKVVCRPLSVYSRLEDKIILAITSQYLTRYFDGCLHDNILSYRPARTFGGEENHVTDFNDGVKLIKGFLQRHPFGLSMPPIVTSRSSTTSFPIV
jgi:hypothetical protein